MRLLLKKETVDDSKLIYRFNAVSDNPIYISLASNTHANAKIYVNGQEIASYFGSATKHSLYLGSFEPGQELEVVCQFTAVGLTRLQKKSANWIRKPFLR